MSVKEKAAEIFKNCIQTKILNKKAMCLQRLSEWKVTFINDE